MLKTYIAIREFFNNEDGASLAEYALIIALVLVGAGAALGLLTDAVTTAIGAGETELTDATATN